MDLATITTGARFLADVVTFGGKVSREQVRVERVLDSETVLVTVESALGTPAALRGLTLPIGTAAIVAAGFRCDGEAGRCEAPATVALAPSAFTGALNFCAEHEAEFLGEAAAFHARNR